MTCRVQSFACCMYSAYVLTAQRFVCDIVDIAIFRKVMHVTRTALLSTVRCHHVSVCVSADLHAATHIAGQSLVALLCVHSLKAVSAVTPGGHCTTATGTWTSAGGGATDTWLLRGEAVLSRAQCRASAGACGTLSIMLTWYSTPWCALTQRLAQALVQFGGLWDNIDPRVGVVACCTSCTRCCRSKQLLAAECMQLSRRQIPLLPC